MNPIKEDHNELNDLNMQKWLARSGPDQIRIAEQDGLNADASAYIYDQLNGKHYALTATQIYRGQPHLAYGLQWSDAHPDQPVLGCVDLKDILDGEKVEIHFDFNRPLKQVVQNDLGVGLDAVHVVPHGDVLPQATDTTKLRVRNRQA